jgi:hypothetical protein
VAEIEKLFELILSNKDLGSKSGCDASRYLKVSTCKEINM